LNFIIGAYKPARLAPCARLDHFATFPFFNCYPITPKHLILLRSKYTDSRGTMAANGVETEVSYEDLSLLENEFDEVDTQIRM
jgi:hypothetical protein